MAPWRRLAWRTTTTITNSRRFQNALVLAPLILLVSHHGGGGSRAMTSTTAITTSTTARTASRVIHLNHAGASIMPQAVLDIMSEYQQLEQNVGGYTAAVERHQQLQQVYKDAATLIHANKPELLIALVESATVAWTRLFYSYCAAQQQARKDATTTKKKNIILVSEAEYAANLVAACQWARTHKKEDDDEWSVLAIPSVTLNDDDDDPEVETAGITRRRSTGKVNLQVLETMLSGKYIYQNEQNERVILDPASIAMVCITHIPTNSGIINPVYEIGNMIAKFNDSMHNAAAAAATASKRRHAVLLPSILYLVDACQSVGQINVNVQEMKCHGLVATGRKYLRGPRGTGFLYIPASIVDDCNIWPHHVDHHGVPIRAVPDSKYVVVGVGVAPPPPHLSSTLATAAIDEETTFVVAPETSAAAPAAAAAFVPVPVESFLDFAPRQGATRFEFYESNIGNKLGLGVALQHALQENNVKMSQTHSVAMYLYDKLQELGCVQLYYKPECGIVTFWIHGFDSAKVKRLLSEPAVATCNDNHGTENVDEAFSFEVSVVPATSTPLDSARTGVPDLLRASVRASASTRDEVDLFCDRLKSIIIRHAHCEKQ